MVRIGWLAVAVSDAVSTAAGQSAISTPTLIALGVAFAYGWIMLDLWRSGRHR